MDEVELDKAKATPGLSRRQFLTRTAMGGAGLAGVGLLATPANVIKAATGGGGNFPTHPNWKFTFVNHVTTNPFFVPTTYALQDACSVLKVSYQWTGSTSSNVTNMVDSINTAVSAGVDGIATSIVDPTAFDAPIANALKAGIPVVSYNADAPTPLVNQRMAYIGQDLYASGQAMGDQILKVVKEGLVAIGIATPGQLNIQPRFDGAQAQIKASGLPITVELVNTSASVPNELSIVEAYYLGHTTMKGFYAVDAGSGEGIAETSRKYNFPSKGIHTGGFDLLPVTLTAIKDGFLQLFLYKLSGGLMFPCDTSTGLKFVTKSNVGLYLKGKSRFEGSTSKELLIK
jgi:simple sugar transport system substrate-binding protein